MCTQVSSVKPVRTGCSILEGLRHCSFKELVCGIRRGPHLVSKAIFLAAYDSCKQPQEAQAARARREIVTEISEKIALEYLWVVSRPRANLRLKKNFSKGVKWLVYCSLMAVSTSFGASPGGGEGKTEIRYDDSGVPLAERKSDSKVAESTPFSKGTWHWQAYGSASFGDNAGELYDAHAGVGYFFRDSWSVNLTALGGYGRIEEEGSSSEDAVLYGADLLIRWHFLQRPFGVPKASLYADGGAGMMQSSVSFPDDGSNFNFRPQVGGGMTYRLSRQVRVMGGARWLHVSNGGIDKDNPGVNQAFVYFGVSVPF